MNLTAIKKQAASLPPAVKYTAKFLVLFIPLYLIEVLALCLLRPETGLPLVFGILWAGMLTGFILCLPKLAGRITFGIFYFLILIWVLAQGGYYQVFGKMLWLSSIIYAGEGAVFLGDVISQFPAIWWVGLVLMFGLGGLVIWKFPTLPKNFRYRLPCLVCGAVFFVSLWILPRILFAKKEDGHKHATRHAIYHNMTDAKSAYGITGIYQFTMRDIWIHALHPLTADYQKDLDEQADAIDTFFTERGLHSPNEMTGKYAGKNVIFVLMESMDDWMITYQDTPTLKKMMKEGIQFTNFYTPGYGNARTLNSEFCMNTGYYLPTTGNDMFDYLDNNFRQSIAWQMRQNGYSAKVFHYNNPGYYRRGELEPAIGYENYVAYSDYESDRLVLCDDNLLFDIPEVSEQFFREGATFNTIITRSAHLGYAYNEIITSVFMNKYPEYVGLYPSEEECSARLKAKVVDDFFKRLLQELEIRGQLENTVIVAMADHYTYGYKNMNELYAHSQVDHDLLLEKVPCFIWSADKPGIQVDKTLNTADLVPTVLNLMGIEAGCSYLGQDAFDPGYKGYAIFPDGSWICNGVAWQDGKILMNVTDRVVSQEEIDAMASLAQKYLNVNNLLLTSDYYGRSNKSGGT